MFVGVNSSFFFPFKWSGTAAFGISDVLLFVLCNGRSIGISSIGTNLKFNALPNKAIWMESFAVGNCLYGEKYFTRLSNDLKPLSLERRE